MVIVYLLLVSDSVFSASDSALGVVPGFHDQLS